MSDSVKPSHRIPTTDTEPPGAPAQAAERDDEFDPMGWEVPLVCKDCGKDFKAPYRHFQAGVVFHCPHCHGSFVPTLSMYRAVRDAVETFYPRRKQERDDFTRTGGDEAAFKLRQERELEEFHKRLDTLAHEMRPAGKMVRRKGLAAMFS